jgi:phenylacetate-CoA ligase
MTARAKYERMRAVHLSAVQAALVDHTARLAWTPEQIEHYREHQLPAAYATSS